MKKLIAVAAAVLLLSGCASQMQETADEATVAPSQEEAPQTGEMAYCEVFADGMNDYQDLVTAISTDGSIDAQLWGEVKSNLEDLDALNKDSLPLGWGFDHDDYTSARDQLAQALESSEVYTFTFTDYKTGVVSIMERCVDAGYSVN